STSGCPPGRSSTASMAPAPPRTHRMCRRGAPDASEDDPVLTDRLTSKLTGGDTGFRAPIGSGQPFGVLDIGTSKTVCLIVAPPHSRANGLWRRQGANLLGYGLRPSRGLKAGGVIDLDGAEQALRTAVTQAEEGAGLSVEEVMVGVGGVRLKSVAFEAE